jgi:hypothetical protein
MTQKLRPLVDADYMMYRIGFAVGEDEPVEFALSTVKHAVNNIWDRFGCKGELYLTGKGNYRDEIATIQVYKGNRDPNDKPFYYQEIKDYLINIHLAEVVHGMEADDKVGIEQYKCKNRDTIIVGQDKDLDMIPGWHYNPVKDVQYYVNIEEANYNFFMQLLTGDRTDNIRGIDGLGPKKAEKLLADARTDWGYMMDICRTQYEKQHPENAAAALHETATLLWIQRKENINYDGSLIREVDGNTET